MDPRLEVLKEMVELLKTTGFEYQFIITPNIGHWFPDDIHVKIIDEAIEFILN
jgi:dipeptidyl aminopeptidase/acylaminoacyl peptidase